MALPPPSPHQFLRRAPRVQLGNVISASLQRENGQRAMGDLQTMSATGGLLQLASALGHGDFVEVAFQTQAGKVQGLVEMLSPVWRAQAMVLQPFRFVALGDDDHRALLLAVDFS